MISIDRLYKSFGCNRVLQGVTAKVASGEFVAIIGKNGTGKSTLLKAIAMAATPDMGRVSIDGAKSGQDDCRFRRKIGYLQHESFLFEDLSARQNLHFYGRFYGVVELEKKIDDLLRAANLYFFRNEIVRTFSRGMIQKLAIARCLIHDPAILLLDEPHSGLDSASAEDLDRTLETHHRQGKTIVMITHDHARAADLADVVWTLEKGRITKQHLTGRGCCGTA